MSGQTLPICSPLRSYFADVIMRRRSDINSSLPLAEPLLKFYGSDAHLIFFSRLVEILLFS